MKQKNDPRAAVVAEIGAQIGVALALLTRLPLPRLPDSAFARQSQAAWAFPLAGLAVAAPAAGLGALALAAGLPAAAAAGLILTVQILLTGAMHEDGLADTADGFWGGFTPERRLEIMKDSRIGTYGVLALVLSVGLRWVALTAAVQLHGLWIVPAVALLSRAGLPTLMCALPPARAGGLSRGVGRPDWLRAGLALGLGLGLGVALGGPEMIPAAALVGLAVTGLAALARSKIGGQTGDILGAAEQLAQIAALLVLATA